jgi:hypothetical protein
MACEARLVSPHERFVSLMRQALEAYEEANCGKKRKPRRRGPLPVSAEELARPIDPEIAAKVERRMVANGWRSR